MKLFQNSKTIIIFWALFLVLRHAVVQGTVVHTCNPALWEAEAAGLQIQTQPAELSKTLSQNEKNDCHRFIPSSLNPNTPQT